MKKTFTILIAAIAAILMMAQPKMVMGQTRTTYNFSSIPTTGWSTSGGSKTINSISWTYSSVTYIGATSSQIQVGSKNNPQTSAWTIQTEISSFGTNKKITAVSITAYTTVTTATYDISVGGSSVKSGSLTTSSATYAANNLNVTSGSIVVTMTGSSTSKAMYLSNISVTYEDAGSPTPSISTDPTSMSGFTYVEGHGPSTAQTVSVSGSNLTANIGLSLGDNSNFEMSQTQNGTYTNSLTLNQSNGTVSATNVYVRLKSGLSKAANYSGTITLTSTGAINKTVSLSGSVTAPTHSITQYSTPATVHGTITFSPESPVAEGTEVTLSAEAADGYDFTANSWVVYKYNGEAWVEDEDVTVSDNKLTMPTYDIKVGGTFTAKPTCVITCAKTPAAGGTLESAPSSAYNGQTVTLTYTEASGYILSSVVITKTEDGSATGITPTAGTGKTFTFTMPDYAVTATATFIPGVTDELTPTSIGVYSSTYTAWTNKTWSSDAVYAGKTSGGDNNASKIQLRTDGSDCGIVTTATGGKVKKIKVTWNASTGNGKKLDIYGHTSAYTGASQLYGASPTGTKLGSITYSTGTYTGEYIITGDYSYLGLRSNDGTIYFDEIDIIWDPIKYTVTYNANTGSGSMSDPNSPYTSNSTVTVLSNSFTAPDGKVFSRWNTAADGSETYYNPGATFKMPKNNVTLYAQWIEPCTVKATMDDVVLNAAYVPGENRIKLEMLSEVYALGGCDITDYGFVYSTSVETPTIGADNCTKIEVGNEYTSAGDDIEATIESATLGATYYVRSYAINNAGTAYSDVEAVTIASSYPTYTISYSTNDNSDGSSTINQGNAIGTLPTPTESYIPDGYEFVGWYNGASYGSTTYPTLVTSATVPTGNMDLKAIFKISPSGGEQCIEITVDDLTGSNNYTTTHSFTKGTTTFNAYGVYKNNGIQMNSGKDTYIKNTNTLPGVITRFAMTWSSGTSVNTITMYANGGAVASTSLTKLAKLSAGSSQSINDLVGSNYNYFYLDGTTVTGACVMTSFKIYYIDYYYTTSATVPSGEDLHVNGSGVLTENSTIPAGSYTLTSTITVPNGKTLTINGYLGTTAEHLVIEDGGQLVLSDDNSVAATVKKTITAPTSWSGSDNTGWYAISSPVGDIAPGSVTNMVLPAVSTVPQYDLYRYDEDMGWYNAQATSQSIATLEKGHGYLYARSANASLSYAGTVTSASFNIENLSKSDVKHSGLHLIGNPYTHDIYLGNAITGDLTTTGYYALNASGSWISTANTEPIKSEQAVFVFVKNNNATISFSNKTGSAKAHHDYIRFTVANSQYEDVAYAMFDKGNGLNKIEHRNSEAPMIYIPQNDDNYAIAMMEDNTQLFGLNFKAATTGRYTLSFDTKGEYNYLHVIDRLTGIDTDMLLEGEYSFIGTPNDSDNRFVVKLAYMPDYSEGNNEIFAFQSGSDIFVSGEGELQVFDVTGRFVMSERINGATTISADALSKGVYVLRIIGSDIKTQKIVVK